MRTLIDDNTGATCFIPESEADRLLLYHFATLCDNFGSTRGDSNNDKEQAAQDRKR